MLTPSKIPVINRKAREKPEMSSRKQRLGYIYQRPPLSKADCVRRVQWEGGEWPRA